MDLYKVHVWDRGRDEKMQEDWLPYYKKMVEGKGKKITPRLFQCTPLY